MKKSVKISVKDVKEYCDIMQKKTQSTFQKEFDNNDIGDGMFSLGGSVAYRDVLDFINKEAPHDE